MPDCAYKEKNNKTKLLETRIKMLLKSRKLGMRLEALPTLMLLQFAYRGITRSGDKSEAS